MTIFFFPRKKQYMSFWWSMWCFKR